MNETTVQPRGTKVRWATRDEGSAYEIGYLDHGWALIKALVPGQGDPHRRARPRGRFARLFHVSLIQVTLENMERVRVVVERHANGGESSAVEMLEMLEA